MSQSVAGAGVVKLHLEMYCGSTRKKHCQDEKCPERRVWELEVEEALEWWPLWDECWKVRCLEADGFHFYGPLGVSWPY